MSVLRLDPLADIGQEQGRAQLQETLDLVSNSLRNLQRQVNLVQESDKIVRPVSVQAFPLAASGITQDARGNIGDIVLAGRAMSDPPPGTLACNGQTVAVADYPSLHDLIGYTFGGSSGNMILPDLRGRAPIGEGTGTGLTARALGANVGTETHQLSSGELASHTHTGPSHTHTGPSHSHTAAPHDHDMGAHVHNSDGTALEAVYNPGAGSKGPGLLYGVATTFSNGQLVNTSAPSTDTTGAVQNSSNTGASGTGATGASGTGATGSAGSNSAHQNMQPSQTVGFFIRYAIGDNSVQAAVLSWGPVSGIFALDDAEHFENPSVSNTAEIIGDAKTPEGVVKVSATGGSQGGANRTITLTGLTRVPYNFRQFKANGLVLRTKITATGVPSSSSSVVTLKVNDPTVTGTSTFLSPTYTRTISESAGSLDDGAYVDAELNSGDLGAAWKPGYLLRFVLTVTYPQTYTTLDVYLGKLEINWR